MKSSTYYLHVKTKILTDFQTCINVPLMYIRTSIALCFSLTYFSVYCFNFCAYLDISFYGKIKLTYLLTSLLTYVAQNFSKLERALDHSVTFLCIAYFFSADVNKHACEGNGYIRAFCNFYCKNVEYIFLVNFVQIANKKISKLIIV